MEQSHPQHRSQHLFSNMGDQPNPSEEYPPAASSNSSTSPPSDAPPSLNYTVRTRSRIIFMVCFWTLVIVDSIFMPIALYFGLWYGTNLSPNTVFSIVTAAIGGVSILEYFLRFWRLFRKSSTCRVIGGRRKYLDWFHWVFTATWLILMVELVVGSTPEHPPIRLLAMPPATLLYVFGVDMAVREGLRWRKVGSPVRISSQPKGAVLRPAVYPFIEDIVACDGSGGTEYRERLDVRYRASHVFRSMLERLTLFWTVGSLVMATVTTILIFTIGPDEAYAVGWSVPFVWSGLWALATWWYVERMLKIERSSWGQKPVP